MCPESQAANEIIIVSEYLQTYQTLIVRLGYPFDIIRIIISVVSSRTIRSLRLKCSNQKRNSSLMVRKIFDMSSEEGIFESNPEDSNVNDNGLTDPTTYVEYFN